MTNHKIAGEIILPEDTATFTDATLFITVENTMEQDVAAKIVAQSESKVSFSGSSIPFNADFASTNGTEAYNIRVHISQDGDKSQFKSGDFINTQSHPVAEDLQISVQLV